MMMNRHYWVYLPEIDEAGCVVEASSFEDAFHKGCYSLCPSDGIEVQIHELGESRSFNTDDVVEEEVEPTSEEYLKTKAFLLDLAGKEDANVGEEVTKFLDGHGSFVCLTQAAHHLRTDPKCAHLFTKIKEALLNEH